MRPRDSYLLGCLLSLGLTLVAYTVAVERVAVGRWFIAVLGTLCGIQAIIQLVLFLHVGQEQPPRWHSLAFVLMLLLLAIFVVGSIWIMDSLNYNDMPMMR